MNREVFKINIMVMADIVELLYVIKRRNIMEGNVTISKKLYFELQVDSEKLTRLESGGVDNWGSYGESLNPDCEPDMDEFRENEKVRIAAL